MGKKLKRILGLLKFEKCGKLRLLYLLQSDSYCSVYRSSQCTQCWIGHYVTCVDSCGLADQRHQSYRCRWLAAVSNFFLLDRVLKKYLCHFLMYIFSASGSFLIVYLESIFGYYLVMLWVCICNCMMLSSIYRHVWFFTGIEFVLLLMCLEMHLVQP